MRSGRGKSNYLSIQLRYFTKFHKKC